MKNYIIILFMAFLSFTHAQDTIAVKNDSIVYIQWKCEHGIENAKIDFENGEYKCYSYGLTVQINPEFSDFLEEYRKKKYGIITKNMGCVKTDYTECYSEVMKKLVLKKFGSDIFERSKKEAEEIYNRKK